MRCPKCGKELIPMDLAELGLPSISPAVAYVGVCNGVHDEELSAVSCQHRTP